MNPQSVRLYLDQMMRAELAGLLRQERCDVLRASDAGQARADDSVIMDRTIAEARILITLGEHFGDWAILPIERLLASYASKFILQPSIGWLNFYYRFYVGIGSKIL